MNVPQLPNDIIISIIEMENKRWYREKHQKHMEQTLAVINISSALETADDCEDCQEEWDSVVDFYMKDNMIDIDWVNGGALELMFNWWGWYMACTKYHTSESVVNMDPFMNPLNLRAMCQSEYRWKLD